jgi:hypothetical protein
MYRSHKHIKITIAPQEYKNKDENKPVTKNKRDPDSTTTEIKKRKEKHRKDSGNTGT